MSVFRKCCCFCSRDTYEPPDVQELDYAHSSLSEVPPEIFTYERTLEKLSLNSNQITDLPPNLFYCHELRELDICDNDLKEIPAAIESLTRLQRLNLCRNALTEVPESLKNCKNLNFLDLSLNQLCKLPESICQLVQLEELLLNETALEFLPANFGRLTKLKILELRDNSLASLPMSMNRFGQIFRLDIGCNDMEELPQVVGSMTNLTELWADDNAMRQDGNTKILGNLPKLICLDISKNNISSISEQIGKCTFLVDLTISCNDISEFPSAFMKLENITTVRADSNRIHHLPEDIGKLKNLQELVLSCNNLRALPLSIGLLRKLHTLYLDDNRLTDLPKEIGSCTSLSVLSVANNSLKEIPSEIGHLSNLRVLILTNNVLRHLPVSIVGLSNLHALWLTEGQNKPMVTLNREIDSATGQHVVTCCLLPQLGLKATGAKKKEAAGGAVGENEPRRSGRKIRFETDVEPPEPAKPAVNGGLLRAPTPYPKELRAMAKHASHIRQTKSQNGEAVNIADEPMYEGDVQENGAAHQANSGFELNPLGDQPDSQDHFRHPHPSDLASNAFSTNPSESFPHLLPSTSLANTSTSAAGGTNYVPDLSSYPCPPPGTAVPPLPLQPPQSQVEVEPPLASSSSGTSAAIGRTPPPYHIAAQRAAFFRSSGGAGTGKINFPSDGRNGGEGVHPHSSSDTPPISPVDIIGSSNLNTYEPIMITSLPQSSTSSGSPPNNQISSQQDAYEPAHVNALLLSQYQNPSGPPLVNNPTDNGILAGGGELRELNDNVPGYMTDSNHPPSATNTNSVGFPSGVLSDRNGNITAHKSGSAFEDHPHHQQPHYHSNNQSLYNSSSAAAQEDSREATMPPAMPLLLDGKGSHAQEPSSHIPTSSHNKAIHFKSDSKICRIPSLQSASATPNRRNVFSTSHASNLPSPSRIPGSETSSSSSIPSPHKEAKGIPPPKNVNAPASSDFQYGSRNAASTSRIPGGGGGVYSSAEGNSGLPTAYSSAPKRNAVSSTGLKYSGGGATPSSSSGIPRMDTSMTSPGPNSEGLKSYSRIPKLEAAPRALPEDGSLRSASSTEDEKRSAYSSSATSDKSGSRGISPKLSRSGTGRESDHMIDSKIPTSRKPWIFGSHRNARVVSVEHTKLNQFKLGFSVTEFTGPTTHPEGKGIYVTATDSEDLPIKVGDKILQVDGIDVGDMGVEIVNKILGNCQENIQLLVSRQH